jgi:hypothetical protein
MDPDLMRTYGRATAIIAAALLPVVVAVFLGNHLDGRLGTEPLFTLLLSLGAAIFGITRLIRGLANIFETDDPPPSDHPPQRDRPPGPREHLRLFSRE